MKKLVGDLCAASIASAALLLAAPAIADGFRPVFFSRYDPLAVVPGYTWTGSYIGLNAGFIDKTGRTDTDAVILRTPTLANNAINIAASATNQFGNRLPGFLGGGQVGYNYQLLPMFVVGIEADIQGSRLRGNPGGLSATGVSPNWVTTTEASSNLDYLGTVRGRIGVTATPALLIYATGGLAYGREHSSTLINFNNTDAAIPGSTSGSISDTRKGWTAGAGLELMLLSNLSAKIEYLHYDLGSLTYLTGGYSVNLAGTTFGGTGIASVATSTTDYFRGDIVRVGLNYKFGSAVAPAVIK
jgi:outer membrane immunogenic protein